MEPSPTDNLKDPSKALLEVANSTLGDWAMMLTEEATSESMDPESLVDGYITCLTLHGPHPGQIQIVATKDFARTLHQNLAGDFVEDIPEDELMDCLREMTNVAAGRLVTEIFGEGAVYDLTDLKCEHIKEEEANSISATETSIFFLGDDCPVGFLLKL